MLVVDDLSDRQPVTAKTDFLLTCPILSNDERVLAHTLRNRLSADYYFGSKSLKFKLSWQHVISADGQHQRTLGDGEVVSSMSFSNFRYMSLSGLKIP
jgi:hypothetical protein